MAGCKPRTFGVVGSHRTVPQPVQQLRQKTFDFSFWNWVVNSILMRDFNQCALVPQKLFLDKSAIILFHQMMKISLKHLAKWNGNFFKKMGQPRPFFVYFRSFQTKITNFYYKYMWKMSVQYMVPGFEPTTFGTWLSSHNH